MFVSSPETIVAATTKEFKRGNVATSDNSGLPKVEQPSAPKNVRF
jgi:hypothetical protein